MSDGLRGGSGKDRAVGSKGTCGDLTHIGDGAKPVPLTTFISELRMNNRNIVLARYRM